MFKSIFLTALCALPCLTAAQPAATKDPLSATLAAMQQQIEQLQQQVSQHTSPLPMITQDLLFTVSHQQGGLPSDPTLAQACIRAGVRQVNSLQLALQCLNSITIAPNVWLTIAVADEPSAPYQQAITISHPQANRIAIEGHCGQATHCELTFAEGVSGVVIDHNQHLGRLANLTLKGHGGSHPYASGIVVGNQSSLDQGEQLNVQGFDTGMRVGSGSVATVTESVFDHNVGLGFYVQGGRAVVTNLTASHNGVLGIAVEYQAQLFLHGNNVAQGNGSAHNTEVDLLSQLNCYSGNCEIAPINVQRSSYVQQ